MATQGVTDRDPADWTVDTLLAKRPEAADVLLRHGMACVGCVMARFETVAEAARVYRLDLRSLLRELAEARRGPPDGEARRRSRAHRSGHRRRRKEGG